MYSVHSDLTFLTQPEDPSSESILSCPAIQIKYLPLVPTSIPKYPVIEMAQVVDQTTNQVLFKASLESEQRGFCPGKQNEAREARTRSKKKKSLKKVSDWT